jgi:hypothetical protein
MRGLRSSSALVRTRCGGVVSASSKQEEDRRAEQIAKRKAEHPDCRTCQEDSLFVPNHDGSTMCQSGSLASGGRNAHCTCDTCF